MSSTRIAAPADLIDLVGRPLGVNYWHQVTEEQVHLFEATFGLVCEVEGSDRPACGAEVVVLYQ